MADNDTDILLEHIDHQLKAVLEGQAAMASVPGDIATLKSDMAEVKDDIKAIKAAVTDHTAELRDHEVGITGVEQASYWSLFEVTRVVVRASVRVEGRRGQRSSLRRTSRHACNLKSMAN
jgi:hypothetical protein